MWHQPRSGVRDIRRNKHQLLHRIASIQTPLIYNNVAETPLKTYQLSQLQFSKSGFEVSTVASLHGKTRWRRLIVTDLNLHSLNLRPSQLNIIRSQSYKILGSYIVKNGVLGENSQNFLRKFVRFFLTLKCFYGEVIHRK
jgi:hypothetical protein